MICRASKPPCEFRRCSKILVEQAIEKQVGGGKERPAKCGWVIVVADGNIVAPHQQANRARSCALPRNRRSAESCRNAALANRISALIAGEQAQLAEDGLGLIF